MKKLSILLVSIALLSSCKKSDNTPATPSSPAQPVVPPNGGTFTSLYTFNAANIANPYGSLVASGTTLYGMTNTGGTNNKGCIFSFNTSGSVYKDMHDFSGGFTDGAEPFGDLTLSGTTLYGMAYQEGLNGGGILFSINTDGSGYTVLYNFGLSNTSGYYPDGSLTLSGTTLYGMTSEGGVPGVGNIFSFNTVGNVYTDLHDFSTSVTDGESPFGNLTLSGTTLYGMTGSGGVNGDGIVFSISTSGSGFTILLNFNGINGEHPLGSLLLSGSTLYGMTEMGGTNGDGAVFSISTTGSSYADLHDFTINSNGGVKPNGSLVLSGSTLYGLATGGGTGLGGTLFSISTGGSNYTTVLNFGVNNITGSSPHGSLILSNNLLYGMTYAGGNNGNGTIFSYSL